MAKKIIGYINLEILAGKATPAPPVGPALGQRGLNIMEFCKAFNAKTQGLPADAPIPVVITAFGDRTFTFITKEPPVSYWLRKAAGVPRGSKTPGREKLGKVTMSQVREIAEKKIQDMSAANIGAAINTVMGTARSMGIVVE